MTETDKRWLKWNWGVPDWRDKDAYPKPDDLRLDEWRWEFERRRPEYREAWLLYAERTYRANIEDAQTIIGSDWAARERRKDLVRSIDDPQFYAKRRQSTEFGPWREYEWNYIQDPVAPNRNLLTFEQSTYGVILFDSWDAFLELPRRTDPDDSGHVAITFDLKRPLRPQLETAEEILEFHVANEKAWSEEYSEPKQRRRHTENWPTYLRILDALDANPLWERSDGPCPKFPGKQTWKAIGDAIFLDANLAQKEVDALIKNNPTQAAQDIYRAAKKLRDNFPF
jgi:hypothetical protein